MARLTDIENAMQSLILGMRTADGYNYNWQTVNEDDIALCTFPNAQILLADEENIDDPEGAWSQAYNNVASFEIHVVGKLQTETTNPNYSINAEHNKALDDLKQIFGITYHLNDTFDTIIMYRGSEREIKMNGDMHVPGKMVTRWEVRYTQDRLNPENGASC